MTMSSTHSSTETRTYTVADVEKVIRSIQADLRMIASSTRAITEEHADKYAHDIDLLAKDGYLDAVDVTLLSASGAELKAARYNFKSGTEASGSARPGGVRWPDTPSGSVRIILHTNDAYRNEADKVSKLPCKISWRQTSEDTTHLGLTLSGGRKYSSNGFGADRDDYS